jgi:bacillithiol biosynthesis cysteine-adding enzyme BshC
VTLPIVNTPLPGAIPDVAPRSDRWNPALEPALFPAPGLDAALARLRQPGALVVTTGQQPGLFTGPSYAVTKALSARGLARALEQRWQRPVVPVYWVPGDDHDLQESGTVSWIGADGNLVSVALPERPAGAPLTPMSRQVLGPEVETALSRFEDSFADTPERQRTVRWLRAHYRPEATVSGAYGGALAELLAPFGVVCLDSAHPVVKRDAAPLLLRAIEQCHALDRELAQRDQVLKEQGTDPGVPVGDGTTLVFLDGELGRDRLVAGPRDGTFQLRRSKRMMSLDDLRRAAEQDPTRLSANVLLRPVVESALLPTVAYLAGPAELRYLALALPLYSALGVPRQEPVPRWSGLLIEPRVTRVLQRYGIGIEELLTDGNLERRIARQAFPPGTEDALRRLREVIAEAYPPVIRAAAAIDPTLERPADAARRQALFQIEKLEKKLIHHARKRESTELGQVARARLSVRPQGKPQERVISMAGFLARYGDSVLSGLADHIARWYG